MRIVVGVTGGIAAYKAAEVSRRLIKAGCEVQVIMTEGAKAFVTPLTFQALTGNPVRDTLLDPAAEMGMGHIELARWADVILIAPASASVIARLAGGFADDLLTTVILASQSPLAVAPAMNTVMWNSPLTQRNIKTLCECRGNVSVIGPAEGEQACGDIGPGRMMEPESLVQSFLDAYQSAGLRSKQSAPIPVGTASGLRIVITSGPTRERLDPVRYLSNDSSGKMGFALAAAFTRLGAQVTLIAGPVQLTAPDGVIRVDVESAADMQKSVMAAIGAGCDIFIGAAAVADYRPVRAEAQKIKKSGSESLTLKLEQNPDILAGVAALTSPPFTVGFAAETQNLEKYAAAKLQSKRVDMIIGNNVSRQDIGFNSEYNEVIVVTASACKPLARQLKTQLADTLAARIMAEFGGEESP